MRKRPKRRKTNKRFYTLSSSSIFTHVAYNGRKIKKNQELFEHMYKAESKGQKINNGNVEQECPKLFQTLMLKTFRM